LKQFEAVGIRTASHTFLHQSTFLGQSQRGQTVQDGEGLFADDAADVLRFGLRPGLRLFRRGSFQIIQAVAQQRCHGRVFVTKMAQLPELRQMKHLKRDDLLMKLGAARQQWPSAWRLVALRVPKKDEEINAQTFTWRLRKAKLRQVRRREGRYLLRTNLTEEDPVKLWEYYIQLTQVEEAFKNLKGDLSLRPVYHRREDRIEAHIFVSFLAYCLHVTLRRWLRDLAPGLTPRSVLEKFAAVQMIDVHLPTTDGRHVILPRYTQPEKELQPCQKQPSTNIAIRSLGKNEIRTDSERTRFEV
jgi:hypothetical protein